MKGWRGQNLSLELYRFGGNKPALLIGGFALILGLVTIFGAITLEDRPVCIPAFVGKGQPGFPGKVIVGLVTEREERLDGCRIVAIRISGHSLSNFSTGAQSFTTATQSPEIETVLVLKNLPANFKGVPVGTRLEALYDEVKETPFAFYFPDTSLTGGGLEIGADTRTDYGKLRLILYLVAGLTIFIGLSVLLIARFYPVAWNPPPRQVVTVENKPIKVVRPKADPITGERPDELPRKTRFTIKPDRLPESAEDEYNEFGRN